MIPWGHHIFIMSKASTLNEALFYIHKIIEGNWSRRVLEDNFNNKLYKSQGAALTNLEARLPATQGKLAKSNYEVTIQKSKVSVGCC